MRRRLLQIVALALCSVTILVNGGISAYAASGKKTANASNSKTMLFPVNEGGWTAVDIQEIYSENYTTPNSGATQFPSRERTLFSKVTAATQKPSFSVVVAHFNSSGKAVKYFTSWSMMQLYVPTEKWTSGEMYKNSEVRTYINTAGYYGQMSTTVSCSGSSMHFSPVIAKINLKN